MKPAIRFTAAARIGSRLASLPMLALLPALMLAACSTGPDWLESVRPQGSVAPTDYYSWLAEAPADEVLRERQRLDRGASAERGSVATVQRALLLSAAPNNPAPDRAEARALLETLLNRAPAQPQGSEKDYLVFAGLWLRHLDDEAALRRLRRLDDARGEEIDALRAEIARLRSSIEAFTTIEQKLVDNEGGAQTGEEAAPEAGEVGEAGEVPADQLPPPEEEP